MKNLLLPIFLTALSFNALAQENDLQKEIKEEIKAELRAEMKAETEAQAQKELEKKLSWRHGYIGISGLLSIPIGDLSSAQGNWGGGAKIQGGYFFGKVYGLGVSASYINNPFVHEKFLGSKPGLLQEGVSIETVEKSGHETWSFLLNNDFRIPFNWGYLHMTPQLGVSILHTSNLRTTLTKDGVANLIEIDRAQELVSSVGFSAVVGLGDFIGSSGYIGASYNLSFSPGLRSQVDINSQAAGFEEWDIYQWQMISITIGYRFGLKKK